MNVGMLHPQEEVDVYLFIGGQLTFLAIHLTFDIFIQFYVMLVLLLENISFILRIEIGIFCKVIKFVKPLVTLENGTEI